VIAISPGAGWFSMANIFKDVAIEAKVER